MNTRRGFVGALLVVPAAFLVRGKLPEVRIVTGPRPRPGCADVHVWLDGTMITRDIPIQNEMRMRRALPGQVLTFTRYRRNDAGGFYLAGGKVAVDVVRAMVIA